ncbi:ParB/RepB/Spo0J family partition protein [Candidatus Peregrinibacteria bacterium]|nr:ParB/RepB/Spo0J family partition protein [Candidatus Peregrinibacteria bacterium]
MSKTGLLLKSEASRETLLPEKQLTKKIVETAYQREADLDNPGDTILGETGTIIRLPSLEGNIWHCPMDWITPNPDQPRSYFDPVKMNELKQTIGSVGQKEAIKVVPYTDGEAVRFFIVDGERRFRTLSDLNYSQAKILVGGETTMEEIFDISLILNISRAQHNPVEIARAFQRRVVYYESNYPANETRRPTQLVAEKYGFSEANVYAHLRLLKLPDEILELIIRGALPMSNALTLLKIKIKKKGDTEETRKFQLQQTARKLLDQIASEQLEEENPNKKTRSKNKKGPSKEGKITTSMIRAAKESALFAEGHGEDAIRLATAEEILKVVGHITAMEPKVRTLLTRKPTLVVAGLRSMGFNRPPEVINDKILEVRVLLEALQELSAQATLPPELFVPKNKPHFSDYLGKKGRHFGNSTRHKIAKALAAASDQQGQVLTWTDLSETIGLPSIEITGNLASLREELRALGLDLQSFDVRRKDKNGLYENYPAYRLSWIDARNKNPLTPETFNFKEVETKSTILSPDRITMEFNDKKPFPELAMEIQNFFLERINALGRPVEFHPIRGGQVIFEVFPRQRQPEVLELNSNLKDFKLNYSIFEKALLDIIQAKLPRIKAILLHDLIKKQDQTSDQNK